MRPENLIRRGRLAGVAAGVVALSMGGATALGQGEAAPNPAGPPQLTSLKMAKVVTSQRGHARFLVGIKTSEAAKLTIIVSSNSDGEPVRTISDDDARPAGRAYTLVEAVDDRGFQLPAGSYKVRIQATSVDNEVSQAASGDFTLRLTRARGQLDALTVPTWSAVAKPLGVPVESGQLVAAVRPKGQAVAAGLRRGDVITKVGGTATPTAGALQVALRKLPADRPVRIEYSRKGEQRLGVIKPKPDWTAQPNWSRILEVARRRDPRVLAWGVAQVRERIDAGEVEEADELLDEWPRAWKASAPGQLLRGDVLQAQDEYLKALAAHSRARKRDRTMAQAWFGRGIALAGLKKPVQAAVEFSRAARLDPKDPAAPAFRSYVLSRAERTDDAITAATAAVALDRRYADAHIPLGIALLAKGDRARGMKALRTGLLLLDEHDRAAPLISEHLDPADP
jgi:hypothetical protein